MIVPALPDGPAGALHAIIRHAGLVTEICRRGANCHVSVDIGSRYAACSLDQPEELACLGTFFQSGSRRGSFVIC